MKLTAMILAGALGLAAAGAAQAMPATPLQGSGDAGLTLVRQGCGYGAHQGPYGGCRLNRGPRGQIRGMMGGAPRGCRPGTHPSGRGYCVRNYY